MSPGSFYCILALGTADIKALRRGDLEGQITRGGDETLATFMEQMQIFYKGKTRTNFTAAPAVGKSFNLGNFSIKIHLIVFR